MEISKQNTKGGRPKGSKDVGKRITRNTPLPKDELLKLVDQNWSMADIAEHYGCSQGKVRQTLIHLDVSCHGYKQPGVRVVRERKVKPRVHKRLLRSDILTKDVLELDSDDNVPAPRSLTHFGTFEKLSRWGFIIHGAIDVYSRYLLYLEASETNDAATVLSCFRKGVEEKGLPVAVRCDPSNEIAGVVEFMHLNRSEVKDRIQYQNTGGGSRFRRVWKEVLRQCLEPYKKLFKEMESSGKLDCNNPVDIYCLHQCYMHLIKDTFAQFLSKWNRHPISTAGHLTPTHLQYVGLHAIQRRSGLEGIHYPELDEKTVIEVNPNHEWPPSSKPSIFRRVLKKKKDRAQLREKFPQESITLESAPNIYLQMRRKVIQLLKSSS